MMDKKLIIIFIMLCILSASVIALSMDDLTDGHRIDLQPEECNAIHDTEGKTLCLLRIGPDIERPAQISVHYLDPQQCLKITESVGRRLCLIRSGEEKNNNYLACSGLSKPEDRKLCDLNS